MKYDLFPALCGEVERHIESGLYEQARQNVQKSKSQAVTRAEKLFCLLLESDIFSYLGQFRDALHIQSVLLHSLPAISPLLRTFVLMSHAYTSGYTGSIEHSTAFFKKAAGTARAIGRSDIRLWCALGIIDVTFHDTSYDRFCPDHNTALLEKASRCLQEVHSAPDLSLEQKNIFNAQFSFRKAMLYWLNEDYDRADAAFAITQTYSTTFFKVWALFGLVNCCLMLGKPDRWQKALDIAQKKIKSWRKAAMKYWPVALLLGRTLCLLDRHEKAQQLYRDILLNVRHSYTNRGLASAEYGTYITRYFYPVYREAVQQYLHDHINYRYALNRAEMFRARYLSEEYKQHHHAKGSGATLTPNIRIDSIGQQLSERHQNNLSILYCFDFRNNGIILHSHNLTTWEKTFEVDAQDYRFLKRISNKPVLTHTDIKQTSSLLAPLTDSLCGRHVLIIPHGIFNQVPFHSLYNSGMPLLQQTTVNYWPSLQMASAGEHTSRLQTAGITFVGTRSDNDSHREITSLCGVTKKAAKTRVLFDPDQKGLRKALDRRDCIVHFVTHGEHGDNSNDLIIIRFAARDMRISELSREIQQCPRLVVLNICYAGLTLHSETDFLHGLPVAFFQKGTETLIVSSRRIEKDMSKAFSELFYHYLLTGLSVGRAYQRAIFEASDSDRMLLNAPWLMGNSLLRLVPPKS